METIRHMFPKEQRVFERLQSDDGPRLLKELLLRQTLVSGDTGLADELMPFVSIERYEAGQTLIEQDGEDNDIYLLLAGNVSIQVNSREMGVREANTHVGEMAALDPAATRSASVKAIGQVITAKISEAKLSEVASKYPDVWKRLALTLAQRLRERSKFVRVPNDRSQVFIGSSVETLPVANEIKSGLRYDTDMFVTVWPDGVFRAGDNTLQRLVSQASTTDFAILVFGPDDEVKFRGVDTLAPRDNVVFEFGLFAGAIGNERTFIVKPRGLALRLPTDLLGLVPFEYEDGDPASLTARINTVCTDIRKVVANLGVR